PYSTPTPAPFPAHQAPRRNRRMAPIPPELTPSPRSPPNPPRTRPHLTPCTPEARMKAVVLHEYGGPDKLVYEDVPDPTPGPGQGNRHSPPPGRPRPGRIRRPPGCHLYRPAAH